MYKQNLLSLIMNFMTISLILHFHYVSTRTLFPGCQTFRHNSFCHYFCFLGVGYWGLGAGDWDLGLGRLGWGKDFW